MAVLWPIEDHVEKLEPRASAGVQPNGSIATQGDEASAQQNWDEDQVVSGQHGEHTQRQAADRSRFKPHSSRARHLLLSEESGLGDLGGRPEIAT